MESRCLTEEMGQRRLRDDVPINLPEAFWTEATSIRNRLLTFRFRHLGKHRALPELVDRTVEPRMNQVFVPLLSIIDDSATVADLKAVMREYHRQHLSDKGMDTEGQLLEVIASLREKEEVVSIGEIAEQFRKKHEDDYVRKVTAKWIGGLIRRKLHLRTERSREGYVIPASENPKVERLMERFGLREERSEPVPSVETPSDGERVNGVNFPEGASDGATAQTEGV